MLSAYNDEDRLRSVLEGYLRQTESDFGIAVADDRSGPGIFLCGRRVVLYRMRTAACGAAMPWRR